MHVGQFTRHANSGVPAPRRGTYAGVVDKIPYLRDLGVTAVELLPVFAFDEQDAPRGVNDWGYQPASFFAPHGAYSSRPDALGALDEFRDMVKALHRAGLEVILDVVYNHTTEGGADGPTLCFRGFGNDTYYILDGDTSSFADYSGCGNTINANQPIVRRLILDSLRYWVTEMHVDGFRFDLASILSRDEEGRPMASPPLLWDIESDPVLANVKLIAEAWDAAGLYQVGNFVGDSWKEWNGRFRDDVRSFLKGDSGKVRALAHRLTGSPDVYGHQSREPEQSINFVACHDGFTLNDLVSYNTKHNEANGHDNTDGSNDNLSWNCGVEGPTDDPAVERLRNRQVKNFLTLTMLSVGTPMLLMGDEVRRTLTRQQQRLLPHRRSHALGLEPARAARGCPSVRERVDRASRQPQPAGGTVRDDAAGNAAAPVGHVARRQTEHSGLGPRLPHAGRQRPPAQRPCAHPRHRQRLLGAARLRASAARRWLRRLAAHHRYIARRPRRRAPLGRGANRAARVVCGGAAFGGAADRGVGQLSGVSRRSQRVAGLALAVGDVRQRRTHSPL